MANTFLRNWVVPVIVIGGTSLAMGFVHKIGINKIKQAREQGIQEGYIKGKEDVLRCLDDARWDYVAGSLREAFDLYGSEDNYSEGATSLDNTLEILKEGDCFNDISDSVRNRIFR